MNTQMKGMLSKNFVVNEKYTIMLFIKQGINAETYRVKGKDGKLYFLKLFNYSKLNRTAFDEDKNLLEIEILKKINHPNIVSYKDNGELLYEGNKFGFLILDFIVGETLADKITREYAISSIYDLKNISSGILSGLEYLHSMTNPIIHNEITPQNIMLDLSGETPVIKIIDFGYARLFHQSSKNYNKEGINLNFVASECFNNIYSAQSDVFSVGALMYYLLYGNPPWFKDVSKFKSERNKCEDLIIDERNKTLSFSRLSKSVVDFDESIYKIIKKALHKNLDHRFQSASEFKKALNGEINIEDLEVEQKSISNNSNQKNIISKKVHGKGFSAIAGMKDLKDQLQLDVIDALHNPEEYAKYGVTIPNGMLLYGPPGCGKTFFAKHFAEEVGFNFIFSTPSTLKSRYVNATQENIAKMFEEAEKNAPTIIFIDEINELLPSRESDAHEMSKSAVNEMLAQMDRTGEKGIFIIGATNYPDMIDPAMLRAGRLDKKFYFPPPDIEARKSMFEMYLKNRPLDFGIDYEGLSILTENYVSSDIEFLVNESSRMALKEKSRITMTILENIIKVTKPSVPLSELQRYESVRAIMNSENSNHSNQRPRIGF
jgi:transitional endoplasmic reticulum ATPase